MRMYIDDHFNSMKCSGISFFDVNYKFIDPAANDILKLVLSFLYKYHLGKLSYSKEMKKKLMQCTLVNDYGINTGCINQGEIKSRFSKNSNCFINENHHYEIHYFGIDDHERGYQAQIIFKKQPLLKIKYTFNHRKRVLNFKRRKAYLDTAVFQKQELDLDQLLKMLFDQLNEIYSSTMDIDCLTKPIV